MSFSRDYHRIEKETKAAITDITKFGWGFSGNITHAIDNVITGNSLSNDEILKCLSIQSTHTDDIRFAGSNLIMLQFHYGDINDIKKILTLLNGTLTTKETANLVFSIIKQVNFNRLSSKNLVSRDDDCALEYFKLLHLLGTLGVEADSLLDFIMERQSSSSSSHLPTEVMTHSGMKVVKYFLELIQELNQHSRLTRNLKIELDSYHPNSGVSSQILASRKGAISLIYYMLQHDMVEPSLIAAEKYKLFDHIKQLPLDEKIDALTNACSSAEPAHPLHTVITTSRLFTKCTQEKGLWKKVADELQVALTEQSQLWGVERDRRNEIVNSIQAQNSVRIQSQIQIQSQMHQEQIQIQNPVLRFELQPQQYSINTPLEKLSFDPTAVVIRTQLSDYIQPENYATSTLNLGYLKLAEEPQLKMENTVSPHPPLDLPPTYHQAVFQSSIIPTVSFDLMSDEISNQSQLEPPMIPDNMVDNKNQPIVIKEPQKQMEVEKTPEEFNFPTVPNTIPVLSNPHNSSSMYPVANKTKSETTPVVDEKKKLKQAVYG